MNDVGRDRAWGLGNRALGNRALWTKSLVEARWSLLGCGLLMFAFHWLFVYLTSLVDLKAFRAILEMLPAEFRRLPGLPIEQLGSTSGRLALAYLDPVVLFASAAWGIGRGSDCVSGELGRGTMEMLLAQPVPRRAIIVTQAIVMTIGCVVLGISAWCGTAMGLATVDLGETISPRLFIPAAINLACLTFFTCGLTTLLSAWDRYRWRTIGIAVSIYLIEFVLKAISRLKPSLEWFGKLTFLGAYLPQFLVTDPTHAWRNSLQWNGILVGGGLALFAAALVIFQRRDLPAPL